MQAFLKDVLCENTTFAVPTGKDLFILDQKSAFESNLSQDAHGCDILYVFESALKRLKEL